MSQDWFTRCVVCNEDILFGRLLQHNCRGVEIEVPKVTGPRSPWPPREYATWDSPKE